MARPSKVDRLPAEIREAIEKLRLNGRTIDEILTHLRQLGIEDIARSSLGEHVQKLDLLAADAKRDRLMADALAARMGSNPGDSVFRANLEMMHGLLFKLNMSMRLGEEANLDIREVKTMTEALRNLAGAAKIDADREAAIEKRVREKALADAESAVDEAAAAMGVTAEHRERIKRRFLGLREE